MHSKRLQLDNLKIVQIGVLCVLRFRSYSQMKILFHFTIALVLNSLQKYIEKLEANHLWIWKFKFQPMKCQS